MKLRYFLLIHIATCVAAYYVAKVRINEAYITGVQDGVALTKKYVVDTDKVCPGWLFQSNMKEVKVRVCGGKRQ